MKKRQKKVGKSYNYKLHLGSCEVQGVGAQGFYSSWRPRIIGYKKPIWWDLWWCGYVLESMGISVAWETHRERG